MSATEIVVWFKDVHGVALTVIWIIAAIRQKLMTLLVAIMMLITENCAYYIFALLCTQKKYWKKALHDSSVSVSVYISVSATRFLNPKLSALCCDLKLTPSFHIQRSIVGRWCHVTQTDSTWSYTTSRVLREREICLSNGGVGQEPCGDEWMDGVVDGSRYSHIRWSCQFECDHCYYYSLHDELAKSADAECSHPRCERVCVHVMILGGLLH